LYEFQGFISGLMLIFWAFKLSILDFFVIETLGYFLKNWAIFCGHPVTAVIMALLTLTTLGDTPRQQRIDRLLIGLFTLARYVFDNTSDITM
jgi:hypothetical protein